jgi:Flp pilus assembly protein TadG
MTQPIHTHRQRGQSLVEMALFFPIFLIIIAGLVEVSNIVVTQNRVNNAARVGSRFGANGGENVGISMAALNAVTQTLELEEDLWDIWAIRGIINEAGTGFIPDSWEFEHVYGVGQTAAFASVSETAVKQEVLQKLQTDEVGNSSTPGIAGGLQFVGVYAIHDINSILGLQALPNLVGLNSVRALSVMRAESNSVDTSDGCDSFPIIVEEGIRSVLPPGQTGGDNRWPDWPNSVYPSSPPNYNLLYARGHRPDVPFRDSQPGHVYLIKNGSGPGQFGWLAWNVCQQSATDLNNALTWPGSSKDYRDHLRQL